MEQDTAILIGLIIVLMIGISLYFIFGENHIRKGE